MSGRAGLGSARTAFDRAPNRTSVLCAERRAAGLPIDDLTESNPTRCGLEHDAALVGLLGDRRGARYDPEPFGMPSARRAVADAYRARALEVDPARVVLAASTSEAYGWLFKLLCDPGDTVLVPRPSYPLLDYLGALESVRLGSYPLVRAEGWRPDLAAVARALEDAANRVRAVVVVHPHNPTGAMLRAEDAAGLERLAAAHGVALVSDEVFGDYALAAGRVGSLAGARDALTFVLNGLSKGALLPQAKLGWIACAGPEGLVAEALARLELVADTYLSVSTAVQLALPELLARSEPMRAALRARLVDNLAALDAALAACGPSCPLRRLPVDGGWYALVEVPRTRSDEAWVERLLVGEGVLVHPGYFFDMEEPGTMVVSLLVPPDVFGPAVRRAVAVWSAG
jgi:aspartate/methionine/tyrosine aminotransferase